MLHPSRRYAEFAVLCPCFPICFSVAFRNASHFISELPTGLSGSSAASAFGSVAASIFASGLLSVLFPREPDDTSTSHRPFIPIECHPGSRRAQGNLGIEV